MQKLLRVLVIFAALVLLVAATPPGVAVGGSQQIQGPITVFEDIYNNFKSVIGRTVSETTANITLYVATTGNDTNDCLTAPTACLTIQAAVNKVPRFIKHQVTINVGAGNFAAFYVTGRILEGWVGQGATYQFTIQGADYINFTPATGTGSGTSNGGDTQHLTDTTQAWTANDLRGKMIYVNGAYQIIRSNTATALETIGVSSSTLSGKAYVIKDWSTIINTNQTFGGGTFSIYISQVLGQRVWYAGLNIDRIKVSEPNATTYGIVAEMAGVYLSNVSVVGPTNGSAGINIYDFINVRLLNVVATGPAYGIAFSGGLNVKELKNVFGYQNATTGISIVAEQATLMYVYADSGGGWGIVVDYTFFCSVTSAYAAYNTGYGLFVMSTQYFGLYGGEFNNNGYGIAVDTATSTPLVNTQSSFGSTGFDVRTAVSVHDNTNDGVILGYGANALIRSTAITGTGNGGYGINMRYGAKLFFTSATTVTGSLGDIKVGDTAYTYATTFAADGSYVNDISEGTVCKRKDSLTF